MSPVTGPTLPPLVPGAADASSAPEALDMRHLQSLLGYNARRAALHIIEGFMQRMGEFGLRTVDFSVMSVICHNPGVTSRQLCAALNLRPPNLVGLVQALHARGLLARQPHPTDGRALGLHATAQGMALMRQAEQAATQLEIDRSAQLSAKERQTLIELLQRVYLPARKPPF